MQWLEGTAQKGYATISFQNPLACCDLFDLL